MKRLFISIDIPNDIKPQIISIQKQLKYFNGKLTEFDNFHLTLKFIGETDYEHEKYIIDKLYGIKFSKFLSTIDHIGVFSESDIRIVWLHLTNCESIQKQVDDALKELYKPENRFMSHLTIARIKNIKNKILFLNHLKQITIPEINFEVNKIQLKESILLPSGPIYKTVKEFYCQNE